MPGINVSILIHGLFFMTQEGNNLRVYAPNIPDHHFIGGIRGSRRKLTKLQDFISWKLQGKTPDPDSDIDGAIMRFSTTYVGALESPEKLQFFKGSILLPWPAQIFGLRAGDITATVGPDSTTNIGKEILANANAKGSSKLATVALLQYTLPALPPVGGVSQLNIHFYLQPCKEHKVSEVNVDLAATKSCFSKKTGFDLQMVGPDQPNETLPTGNLDYGTTEEDELTVHEEHAGGSLDIQSICKSGPTIAAGMVSMGASPVVNPANSGTGPSATASHGAVNPANCPVLFIG
jgi:hypothetical protein